MSVGAETKEILEEEHGIPADKVCTVAQAAKRIDTALDKRHLRAAHVIGEVSNVREWKNNCFFTIKDQRAKLQCVLFSQHIDKYRPDEGDRVLVRGELDFYHDQGSLSLRANTVVPVGEGEYYRKLRQLKKDLRKEGIFEQSTTPPRLPDKIGLITSDDSDALSDVRNSLWSQNASIDIVLAPVSVQGDDAEDDIVNAIRALDKTCTVDSIIIARGGGDIEALQPFNTRTIAETIANTDTPVITGIGHQNDETIAGLAADVRGYTPTDAGKKATDDIDTIIDQLKNKKEQLNTSFNSFQTYQKRQQAIESHKSREKLYRALIVVLALTVVVMWAVV